jgi:hypothetical protein
MYCTNLADKISCEPFPRPRVRFCALLRNGSAACFRDGVKLTANRMKTSWLITSLGMSLGLLCPWDLLAQNLPAKLPDLHLSRAGTVNAMVLQPDGRIVIGGSFTSINDVPLTNLARIDRVGAVDSVWAPNPDGAVSVLALSDEGLFVGGSFQNVGGEPRNGLARLSLNGSGRADPVWNPKPDLAIIRALAVADDSLLVAGGFGAIANQPQAFIAKIKAAGTGAVDPAWRPTPNGVVDSLVVNGSDVFLGGHFTKIGGSPRFRLAKVSLFGSGALDDSWAPAVDPEALEVLPTLYVSSMLISETDLVVSGLYTSLAGLPRSGLAKLDTVSGEVDQSWNPRLPTSSGPLALAANGTNLYVGGSFAQVTNQLEMNLAKISLSGVGDADPDWTPSLNSSNVNVLLPTGTWLLVGGSFSLANNAVSLGIAKLNQGVAVRDDRFFAQIGNPGIVRAMVRLANGSVIVGGDFWLAGTVPRPNLARMDPAGALDPTWATAADGSINALALDGSDLFVGGAFVHIGGQLRHGLAKVDTSGTDLVDSKWRPGLSPSASVNALGVEGQNLYVAGSDLGLDGHPSLVFTKISTIGVGTADANWHTTGDGPARAVAVSQDSVFLGGEFRSLDDLPTGPLGRFLKFEQGTIDRNWKPRVDAGPSSPSVYALAVNGVDLFVGGVFETVNGWPRFGLAKINAMGSGEVDPIWDPTAPNSLGPVSARALVVSDASLYVGGDFGPDPVNFARVSLDIGFVDSPRRPNPRGGRVLAILPAAQDVYVGGEFSVFGEGATGSRNAFRSGFAFLPVADAPVFIRNPGSSFAIVRNPDDGEEVTHFQIVGITGGDLVLADGGLKVRQGEFITVAQAAAGLIFLGANGTITAVSALDGTPAGAGTSATSLNIADPPKPVFSFTQFRYEVEENAQFVLVVVRKDGSGEGSVSFTTTDGSAIAGADYGATAGSLTFGLLETNRQILIPIADDSIYEGDETFSIRLFNPGGSGFIGNPATASIRIIENDFIGSVGSFTNSVRPSQLPPAIGVITVTLQPPEANGRWRLAGEGDWHRSGETLTNLVTGVYRIDFRRLFGYQPPDALIAPVNSGDVLKLNAEYIKAPQPGVGYITIAIAPTTVAGAVDETRRGQWRLVGANTWLNSGEAVTDLPAGSYDIEFKELPGWVGPMVQNVEVFDDEGSEITGTYIPSGPTSGARPVPLPFETAVNSPPAIYVGQFQTPNGLGSGVVVRDRVVLTAAQLVFDDVNLRYVSNARWFFQRYSGHYEPVGQVPRGWHVFSGYAAQRQADKSPGDPSLEALNQDLAAVFFLESAGRGGYGGYLVSDTGELLTSDLPKMLLGYPIAPPSSADRGKPHAASSANATFAPLSSTVFYTKDLQAYAGFQGGPLEVRSGNGNYYPAGIYVGSRGSAALVRVLDREAANLILRADLSATARLSLPVPGQGPRQLAVASVGVVNLSYTAPTFAILRVRTGPDAALLESGGWQLGERGTPHRLPVDQEVVTGTDTVEVRFLCTGNYALPPRRLSPIRLADGQTQIMDAYYLTAPPPPSLSIGRDPGVTLYGGVANCSYRVEYTDRVNGTSWTALPVVTVTSGSPVFIPDLAPRVNTRFYRVVWMTCPP